MSLGDRFPIDPLSEEDWADVARAVDAELEAAPSVAPPPPARRWRLVAGVAGGLAAAAAVVALVLTTPPPAEAPSQLHATRLEARGEPVRAMVGDVSLSLSPGAELVVVDHAEGGTIATLERGAVRFAVPPRAGRAPFVVQAADVRVTVIGTRFSVSREGARVEVAVERGVVAVTREGASTQIEAGERWPQDAPADGQAAAPREEASRAGGPRGTLVEHAEPTAAGPSPPSARERGSATGDDEPARGQAQDEDPRALFDRAAALERTDPDRALALYARVVARDGGWAPAALFARGRLEHDRGDHERAGRLLRLYLERYPRGINADDARRLLAR